MFGTGLAYAMGAPGEGVEAEGHMMSFLPIILIFVIFYFLAHSSPAETRKRTSGSVSQT